MGIFKSLKESRPEIRNSKEAITLAIQKEVTSGNGKGNGLWILERIVMANGGSLEISSDGVRFSLIAPKGDKAATSSFSKVATSVPGTTLVDFQLDTHKPMVLEKVLDYKPVDLWLEAHEDDFSDKDAVIRLKEESRGFGTRLAAREVRTKASNLSREFNGRVVIDFNSVELISTSYADELIAKLLNEDGIRERLALRNVGEMCRLAIGEALGGSADITIT